LIDRFRGRQSALDDRPMRRQSTPHLRRPIAAPPAPRLDPSHRPGGGLRSDPDLLSSSAAQLHPSRRCIDLDDVDRADRACRVGVHRCDIGDLDKMSGKQFIGGRHW